MDFRTCISHLTKLTLTNKITWSPVTLTEDITLRTTYLGGKTISVSFTEPKDGCFVYTFSMVGGLDYSPEYSEVANSDYIALASLVTQIIGKEKCPTKTKLEKELSFILGFSHET